MFLQTNDRLVNLKNVSNINIIIDNYKRRFRIVFNMNYNIMIQTDGGDKFISDYVYWDSYNEDDLQMNIAHIKTNMYFNDNFIDQLDGTGFININEISSVKLSEKKNRVIFNLSHPVTFTDYEGNEKITSEFVYVNCGNRNKYNDYVHYVNENLGE